MTTHKIIAALLGWGAFLWASLFLLSPGRAEADAFSAEESAGQESVETTRAPVHAVLAAIRDMSAPVEGVRAATRAFEAACASLPTDPVVTLPVVLDGGQALVYAMPPGSGAWSRDELISALERGGCVERGRVVDGLPTSGRAFTVTDSNVSVVVWSRGDIVVAFAGDIATAQRLDSVLTAALREHQCRNLDPVVADYRHNPYVAGDAYVPVTMTATVHVDPIVPVGPDGTVLSHPTSFPDAGPPVVPMQVPDGRVYWPAMPSPVDYPTVPKPLPQPSSSATYEVPTDDVDGPGCGWAFYAMDAVVSRAATPDEEAALANLAHAQLEAQWQAWAESVVTYWTHYDEYVAQIEKYQRYRHEVAQVETQWRSGVIQAWDAYEAQLAQYNAEVESVARWQEQYDSALESWSRFLDTCVPDGQVAEWGQSACSSRQEPSILSEEPPVVTAVKPERPQPPEQPKLW